jgi:hypothetical protein
MSTQPTSNLFLYIGKPLKDEYGRQVGKVVSFAVSPNGRVDGVFVEHNDGEFLRYSNEQIKVDGEAITLLTPIKLRVKTLCDEIPLIWRKDQALNELVERKKVPSEMFSELHKNFEGALNQLKAEAQSNLESIEQQIMKCNEQIRELNSALIHIEIEREIGRIDDTAYQTSSEILQEGFKTINSEKSDLESMKSQLSNLVLGETPSDQNEVSESAESEASPPLPEPPVVVHLKSASETDI